jgi:hypothetical protein
MTRMLVALLLALFLPLWTQAQSLVELAKEEATRRQAVGVPAKVYTNRDLNPEPKEHRAAAADAPRTELVVSEVPSKAKDEAHWRALITAARSALERSRVLAEALQSRLNALATDIVNRDDPAQRAQLERDRQRVLVELNRTKIEIAEQGKAITEIEEDARKAGVPPGWLR